MRKKISIILCLSIIFLIVHLNFVPGLCTTLSSYLVYPFLLMQYKIVSPIKHYFATKHEKEVLEATIKKLSATADELMAENVSLRALLSFEQETKEIRDFKCHYYDKQAKLAHILIKHFSDQSHYFLIDKGSCDGIELDMVAVYKNCLVGKVIEVYPYYSKIVLITDSVCKIAAYCAHTKISGIHEGKNQEALTILNYVSHLDDIEENDVIISSGQGLVFPKGFGLGKIKTCKVNGLMYDVELEPLIDIRALEYCYIMRKGNKNYEFQFDDVDGLPATAEIAKTEDYSVNRFDYVTMVHDAKNNVEIT